MSAEEQKHEHASGRSAPDSAADVVDARALGRGLAALRIFVGFIFFANGLAKLFSLRNIDVGPYSSFLINRDETRSILRGEAARNDVPGVTALVNDVLLPSYGWLQWVVTFVELGVGALLILGLASRGAALIGSASSCGYSCSTCPVDDGCSSNHTNGCRCSSSSWCPPGALGGWIAASFTRDPAPSRLPVLAAVAR